MSYSSFSFSILFQRDVTFEEAKQFADENGKCFNSFLFMMQVNKGGTNYGENYIHEQNSWNGIKNSCD